MPSFFSFLITKKFPSRETVRELFSKPLNGYSGAFFVLFFCACASLYFLIIAINSRFLVTVPARGGELTEGVLGAPHFINPILAQTQTDLGLTSLVYAGLTKEKADGSTALVLAKNYTVSPDGKTYTFTLAPKTQWSDGKPLTSADIAFTVNKMQDSSINKNLALYWQTINIDTPSDDVVVFMLPAPDTHFPTKASFGILPKHIWEDIPAELFESSTRNLKPVGAGAFSIQDISYNKDVPELISLKRNPHYVLGSPFLRNLNIAIYANQTSLITALRAGEIDFSFFVEPTTLAESTLPNAYHSIAIPTPYDITLYRLKSESMLSSSSLVTIINQYIDKNKIIDKVENGYGTPRSTGLDPISLEQARTALNAAGYTISDNTLHKKGSLVGISIAVENEPRLLNVARTISEELAELGMIVSVKAFDPGTFREEVQNGRYSVILARALTPQSTSYQPVLELYTESVALVSTKRTGLPTVDILTAPQLRYSNAEQWYAQTDRVWKW